MLLSAKITKPLCGAGFIDRPRLYAQLDHWYDHSGIFIQAPTGYGKSALISRWLEIVGLDENAAWLSLDAEDNDPFVFMRYLVAAMERCLPGVSETMQPVLHDHRATPRRLNNRLLSTLEEVLRVPASGEDGRRLVLILDDLHRVTSQETNTLLHRLLEYGPANLHLLLLSRRHGELPIARLYAQGVILSLDKEDLRFSVEEVQEYLQVHGFRTTSEEDVAQLTRRCEGWVTALHLAILSLREPGNMPELLRVLEGGRGWLARYLADEVFERQPSDRRQFLLKSSILNSFNADLCAAVTGMADATTQLADLERADLFLAKLNDNNGWYRYHHLFQELLQKRLVDKSGTRAVACLHLRAGAWLASHGKVTEALRHFLAAGAEEEAIDLVESQMTHLLVRNPLGAKELFALLSNQLSLRRPRLALDRCMLALIMDDRQTMSYVQQARESLQLHGLSAGNAPALYGKWLVLRSGAQVIENDFHAFQKGIEQARRFLSEMDDLLVGTFWLLQVHSQHFRGDRTASEYSGEQALAAFRRADFLIGAISVQRNLAKQSFYRGDSKEASRRFSQLVDDALLDRPEALEELLWFNIYAAENSYWQYDLVSAEHYRQSVLAQSRQLQNEALTLCCETMGHLYSSMGAAGRRGNWRQFAHFEGLASRSEFELFLDLEIRHLTAVGFVQDAWSLAQKSGIETDDKPAVYRRRTLIPYLRAYIAQGTELAAVTSLLDGAYTYHEELGNRFFQLQLLSLKSWQQLKLNGSQATLSTLIETAHLAEETGYLLVLMDIPDLIPLLFSMDGLGKLEKLSAALEKKTGPLTGRELYVLQLLANNLTYKQIGEEMTISINTVRDHIRNIYSKLHANSRGQAIAAAQRLRLLD